jgi:hypothetical protein
VEREVGVRFGFTNAPELEQPGDQEAQRFLETFISDQWVELVVLLKTDTGSVIDRLGAF